MVEKILDKRYNSIINLNKSMKKYYIKTIWGPAGQEGYPENNNNEIEFADGQKSRAEAFLGCAGFLLYETGHRENGVTGTKAIYAYGRIISEKLLTKKKISNSKVFLYHVKVELKRIGPELWVPLKTVRKIRRKKNMQAKGGLIKVSAQQFERLKKELNKTYAKTPSLSRHYPEKGALANNSKRKMVSYPS